MKQNKSKNKNIVQNNSTAHSKSEKSRLSLFLKFAALSVVAIVSVVICDKINLFAPDNSNNHTARKWNSFYKFTKKDTVDVIFIGNSHCYSGINPKNLSAALGANCFVLASPGTTIMDSYYCLEEALTKTQPKIVVIETYGIRNTENRKLDKGQLSDQFKSFNARKNKSLKIQSTPKLFSVERYLPAWSTTIRNHDFIFRDTAQLKKNIDLINHPKKETEKLYLGRFVAFSSGITDSIIHLYDSLGAPVDGNNFEINDENEKYTRKIIELCRKNNIRPVFVTIPMYYRHVKNYSDWHNKLETLIKSESCEWLDLQELYDTTNFNRDCFENTYAANQHSTYLGSLTFSYRIAEFLKSLSTDLPDRSSSKRWQEMFYGEEGFFENFPSRNDDTTNVLICSNRIFNDITIKDAIFQKNDKSNKLFVKLPKENQSNPKNLTIFAKCRYKNNDIVAKIDLKESEIYKTPNHSLYITDIIKDFEIKEILQVSIQ